MFKKFIEFAGAFIEQNRLSGIIIAMSAFILVFLLSLTAIYETFELTLYDMRFKIKPPIKEWERLTFIDIDENSITNIGQFPWPRNYYGKGCHAFKELGVSQASFDMMFLDHSPVHVNSPTLADLEKKAEKKIRISPAELENIVIDNDKIFSKGVADMGKVILSYTFNLDPLNETAQARLKTEEYREAVQIFNKKSTIKVGPEEEKRLGSLVDKTILSIVYPIPELIRAGRSFGFVNRYTDIDGTTRKVRLVQLFQGRLYFNLSLVMLMDMCGVSVNNVAINPGKNIILKNALNPMTHETDDIAIPIDDEGMMFVNWSGKSKREESFHVVPFYALLDYADYFKAVHEFFNRVEEERGICEIARLNGEIDTAIKAYRTVKDPKNRKDLWKTITKTRSDLSLVKKSYTEDLKDEIALREKELKIKTNPERQRELEILKDDLKAINLVIRMEDELADKITITGLTATGTHDIGTVPVSKEYAQVGVYHNTINTIINKSFITRAGDVVNYLIMIGIALLMGYAIQRMNARVSLITIGASLVFINIITILLFSYLNVWINQVGVNLSLILPSLSIAGIKFLKEESQKKFIKNAFSYYLAPGVIDQIIQHPESLELGGSNRNITIFFSDVAKFSAISEKLTPQELVTLLNEYLTEMTAIILAHGGTVDKYIGDAIMAFYGAPHSFEDHALRSCLAAIDMKKRLRELQEEWRKQGKEELHVRMGINTGEATVGNMGSKSRMDYTVMGDAVNLASRLEGANKFYGTYAMISHTTYDAVKDQIDGRKLDIVRVVGKQEAIKVYELLGKKGSLPQRMYDMMDFYDQGMELFSERQWKRALGQFNRALEIIDNDGPSLTYRHRCLEYIKKPPPKTWDGVYSFKSK